MTLEERVREITRSDVITTPAGNTLAFGLHEESIKELLDLIESEKKESYEEGMLQAEIEMGKIMTDD